MSIARGGTEYEVNPATGTITIRTGPSAGETVDTVSIGGTDYRLAGNKLVGVDDPFNDQFQLGTAGPSAVVDQPGYGTMLTNQIQRSSLNASAAEDRVYGISGSVSVILPSGEERVIDIGFSNIARSGQRLYVSTNEEGTLEYNSVDLDGTNTQLREYLHDETARYATPVEAEQHALYMYASDPGKQSVQDAKRAYEEQTGETMSNYDFGILAANSNIQNLSYGSRLFVPYPGSTYRAR